MVSVQNYMPIDRVREGVAVLVNNMQYNVVVELIYVNSKILLPSPVG